MWGTRTLVGSALLGLVATGVSAPTATATPGRGPAVAAAVTAVAAAGQGSADSPVGSALRQAAQTSSDVEVPALTTGTDRVWATPAGLLKREIYGLPVRVRRGSAWAPLDNDLTRS